MLFRRELGSLALIAVLLSAPISALPRGPDDSVAIIRAVGDIVSVREGEEIDDDYAVVANRVLVDGMVHGDLIVFADQLQINGRVDGDVTGFARQAVIVGEVGGSVRLLGGTAELSGEVKDDLVLSGLRAEVSGLVGRDLYALVGELVVSGTVGGDVEGRATRAALSGRVQGDFRLISSSLAVTDSAIVGGTLTHRSNTDADIDPDADIGLIVVRQPEPVLVQVRAAQVFAAVVLAILFMLGGLAVFWLFPRSLRAAVERLRTRPIRTLGLGLLVVATPLVLVLLVGLLVAFGSTRTALPVLAVLLPLTLAVSTLVALGALIAPIPVLTAIGRNVIVPRLSAMAGFVISAVLWLLVIWIPYVGVTVAALVVIWGFGAWAGGWTASRGEADWAFERARRGRHRAETVDPSDAAEEASSDG